MLSSNVDSLIVQYKPMVVSIARQYYLKGGEIEDLIQEGMIGLYKAIQTYNSQKSSFETFAYLCIKRQILSAIKKSNAVKNEALNKSLEDDSLDALTFLEAKDLNPEDKVISSENLNFINSAIESSLLPFEKQVLNLYLEGLSYAQISKQINKPIKTIDNTLFKIRKKLQYLQKIDI